jgi:hypothetical protein
MISPIITLGLNPIESKLVTWGYGPDALIEVTVIRGGGGRGTSGKKREEERILRIRVTDEDGRKFIQELPETELKNIRIQVTESRVLTGDEVYIYVKEHLTGNKKKIKFRVKDITK